MLRLKDLMRPEPADAKAPGEPDEIKYRRHRRRALDVEESPDEALTMMQRLKKARSLKRYKAKIKIGRMRAMRRTANKAVLQKRSRRAARNFILQRITKGIPKSELSFARRQELEKRLEKPAMKQRINKIALRLLPKMRKREMDRKRGKRS